jgi:calcineurin-like phosphoesterase family protein
MILKRKLQKKPCKKQRVFLISDTHFHHDKIIEYCNRPFGSTGEMDEQIIRNWNTVVNPDDLVYFLGDFCMGNGGILQELLGKKIFIRGNHDKHFPKFMHSYRKLTYRGINFILIHDPGDVGRRRGIRQHNGWVIHGHLHNNEPLLYPHIHPENCTVNVSVEMIDYTPINLDTVCDAIIEYGMQDGRYWCPLPPREHTNQFVELSEEETEGMVVSTTND